MSALLFCALLSPNVSAREAIAYFGTEAGSGSKGGEFNNPSDVAVNGQDVYVVDANNNRIQRFVQDDNGTPADPFDDSFAFVSAWGADVDGSTFGDSGYEICTVAAQCKAATASGGDGTVGGDGALGDLAAFPESGIAVDADTGNVYVTDRTNFRINSYTAEGAFLRSFGFDVVAAGPGNTGTGYEICIAADGDVCKAGLSGSGIGQIGGGARGIALSPPDGNPATGTVFLADGNNRRVNTYGLDGSASGSFGSAAEFTTAPVWIATDSRGIVYVSYFNGSGQVVARYDSQNANGGGVGFLAPISAPPLALSPDGGKQVSGLEVDPDSDGAGPDEDILYVLRNLGPEPETVVQQFGPVNDPGLTAPPAAEDAHHGSAAGFNFVRGLGLDTATGRLFVSTSQNIAGPFDLPDDNHGVYVLDTAGSLPEATLESLSGITADTVTLNGTVDPNGPPTVSYRAEYSLDGTSWTKGPEIPLGTQEDPQPVSATIDPPQGLQPGTAYHVRLVATKRFAIPVPSNELTFETDPSPPLVETVGAPVRSAATATLNGRVNPRLAPTEFHFEYVSAADFATGGFSGAQSTPSQTVGVNEVQTVWIKGSTSGQFKLSFEGETTSDLDIDAPAAAVQSALRALPTIGSGNVRVRGGGRDSSGHHLPYTVIFTGDLAATDVGHITASDGTVPLDDDAGGTVITLIQGGGGNNEVQQLTIKAGFGSYRLTFGSQTTGPIRFNATPAEIRGKLASLSSIGPGNVGVKGGPGDEKGENPYLIEFKGTPSPPGLAGKDVGQLSVSDDPTEPLEMVGDRGFVKVIIGGEEKEIPGPRIGTDTAVEGGPANLARLVSARVADLAPATTYLYRVLADNGNPGSPTTGETMAVTTRASDAPLSHGDFPGPAGSDRAFEQINLPDTGGNPVSGSGPFSPDGNRAIYSITGGTPASETGTEGTQYLAERAPDGWQTLDIFPPREALLGADFQLIAREPDLSRLYALNTTPTGETTIWRLVPHLAALKIWTLGAGLEFSEGSSGTSILPAVATETELIAAMLHEEGLDEIYDVSSGPAPQPISLMPDGEPAPCGTTALGFELSADGRRLLFASSGDRCSSDPNLYLRDLVAGQTELLSGPVLSGPDCGASLIRANSEAIFFFSQSRLAEEDTRAAPGCPEKSDGDVYRYDLATDSLECVTCLATEAGVDADVHVPASSGGPKVSIAVAPDGGRVYFQSPHPLLRGTPKTEGEGSLYVTEPATGELRWVASVAFGQSSNFNGITPDGAAIEFRSDELGLNPVGGTDNGGTTQVYRYDDRDRSLVCVSCPSDGSEPRGAVSHEDVAALSDSGQHLAFATPTPLVDADQNTAGAGRDPAIGMDVYEWRDGRLFLISDGLTNWPREFETPAAAGMSPSGQDLYFLVAAQLTPDALDAYRRLYTARIGGGIEFPKPAPPCPLEVCQGTPRGVPQRPRPLTADVHGAGNPAKARRRCPKGKRRVRRKGRVRCVKRHHRAREHRRGHRHQGRTAR